VPVSLEHLRHVDPQTRIAVGYRLDVTPAESPQLRRRLPLPPDPRITLHFDEVVFPQRRRAENPGLFGHSKPVKVEVLVTQNSFPSESRITVHVSGFSKEADLAVPRPVRLQPRPAG
jgi:hypothetical protein